jgi:hypothetical protein
MQVPVHVNQDLDYIMTGRVRLLVFWAGKDDVGGGYIRRGVLAQDPASDVIELLIGSDPAKAPRAINRWGAASEIAHKGACCLRDSESSVFFGFMKVSKGSSVSEMEKELAHEKGGGDFSFSAIINQGDRNGNFARVVPFSSSTDFTINQFDQAKSMVFERLLGSDGRLKQVESKQVQGCGRQEGFLETVADLIDVAMQQHPASVSLCYLYNGEQHQLKLEGATPDPAESIRLSLRQEPHEYVRNYRDLILARFEDQNRTNQKKSNFELLLGTKGELRGVPVQIRYQPNWWFEVILNLKTSETVAEKQE